MRFRDPIVFLLLASWIPMVWIYLRREKRTRPAIRYSDLSLLRIAPRSLRWRLRHLPFALRIIGIGLLTVALARPQKGSTEEEVSTEGVDIVLALDVSTSMKALDFQPKNRLHVAKETIKSFIDMRRYDRIGLVVFAGRSFTKCPLTLDYGILHRFVEDITFDQIEDGTAIGTAIATAANRIRESPAESKVIILLTDGANNRGDITPRTAAGAAAELGIKIYTIAVGRQGQVPYPVEVRNPWTGQTSIRTRMVEMEVDEQVLVDIAETTGGEFFRAHNAQKLKEIYEHIDKLEKTEIKTTTYTNWAERFVPWLVAGAVALLVELLLTHTVFRRIP